MKNTLKTKKDFIEALEELVKMGEISFKDEGEVIIVQVHDFEGFDKEWNEVEKELSDIFWAVYEQLPQEPMEGDEFWVDVFWDSEDI